MKKIYRPNVAAIIMDENYPSKKLFLLARRLDLKEIWQFPQGGIDKKESPIEALFRELEEEIGTKELELIASMPKKLSYDYPEEVKYRFHKYQGQEQQYFLLRLKNNKSILLATANPEFDAYDFYSEEELFKLVKHFKKNIYKEAIEYFKKEGYL